MPNRRRVIRATWIVLLVALPVGLGVSCFGPLPDHEAVRLLPGTDKVTCAEDNMSLSPDDRWLVFSEMSAPISEWGKIKPKYHYQMASIDLRTTKKTNHRLPIIFNDDCHHGFKRIGYVGEESWGDGFFILAGYDRRRYLVLDPQNEFFQLRPRTMETVTCSDCPPYYLDPKHPETYSGLHMSRSWHNGRLGKSVFECSRKGIIKTSPGKEDVVVVKAWPKKRFQMDVDFRGVRISPDERYLAYRFHRGLMDIFPGEGGRTHLYLKDLETGKDFRLISMKYFGNLIWSSDSKRLYFSAQSGRARRNDFSRGICYVDIKDVFEGDGFVATGKTVLVR